MLPFIDEIFDIMDIDSPVRTLEESELIATASISVLLSCQQVGFTLTYELTLCHIY